MFGFFRRQSKKFNNNNKTRKSKDPLSNIQCVQVDRYEIEFYKPKELSQKKINSVQMGSSESTNKKQVSESIDQIQSTNPSNNNNNNNKNNNNNNSHSKSAVYDPDLESRWATKKNENKDESNVQTITESRETSPTYKIISPSSTVSTDDDKIKEMKIQQDDDKASSKIISKNAYARQNFFNLDINKSNDSLSASEPKRINDTAKSEELSEQTNNTIIDSSKNLENDSNYSNNESGITNKIQTNFKTESNINIITNLELANNNNNNDPDKNSITDDHPVNDNTKQELCLDILQNDADELFNDYGTAPSSPTDENINNMYQTMTNDSISQSMSDNEEKVDSEIFHILNKSNKRNENYHDVVESITGNEDNKHMLYAHDRNNYNVNENYSYDLKCYDTNLQNIQIPNIMVTESSDSEGENDMESEEELENFYNNSYARAYPSMLYDITEVEEFSDASDVEFTDFNDNEKRNIVHQESKFQEQINMLKCEIEIKDAENIQLRGKINELQREITNKTWGMDRLYAELESFQKEADCVRKKLLKVEEELNKYKSKNIELNEELLKKLECENDFEKIDTLQNEIEILNIKILELQTQLKKCEQEKDELQKKLVESEIERRTKLETLQCALDDALKQKQKLQDHIEEEYEKLRTLHSDREQQLLDDFEWKLREVEIKCKQKLEDKDKESEEKLKQQKKQLENEISQLKTQIKEVDKMKSYEAEVTQLRGLTQEQQRSLKIATRTTETLHSNERILNEEIDKLRSSLEKERSNLTTVQNIHSRELAEKDRKYSFRLEQQKNELNSQWEDKIKREIARIKLELEKNSKEEKRKISDEAKSKADLQLKEQTQMWEKKMLDSKKELESIEQKLTEKEESYRKELLRLQTNSDSDMLELRRKLDKLDLSYQEQLEKMQEKHEKEIETLQEEYEKKIEHIEQNWSQQVSSTKSTLNLIKEQLQRETECQLEALSKKYILQLEEQYDRLIKEKEEAIEQVKEKYINEIHQLKNQLNQELKNQKVRENELTETINQLKEEVDNKGKNEQELEGNMIILRNEISELRTKISVYENLTKDAETAFKKREYDHAEVISKMKQSYENKIRYLQSKLLSNEKHQSLEKDQLSEVNEKPTEDNSIIHQSKSSRRRGRTRHKNQKYHQNRPHLTQQYSSSSL